MKHSEMIMGIRDAVVAVSASNRVVESKGSAAEPRGAQANRANRFEWDEWISDVSEAVEQFIGMGIEVLPRMPWRKWYESGLSAVVAAKNAAQMYEDSKDDGAFDFSVDAKKPRRKISEQFPVGRDSYSEWAQKVQKRIESVGRTLVGTMEAAGVDIKQLHALYNAEYDAIQVANEMLRATQKDAVEAETPRQTRLRKRMAAIDELAEKLGMRRGRVEEEEDDEEEEEESEEENDDQPDEERDDDGDGEDSDEEDSEAGSDPEDEEEEEGDDLGEQAIRAAEKAVPAGMPKLPPGKVDLSGVTYEEETSLVSKLGEAMGMMNMGSVPDGSGEGNGSSGTESGETD